MVPCPRYFLVLQDNSCEVLFNGLLTELLAILDSFFTITISDYIGVVIWGGGKS